MDTTPRAALSCRDVSSSGPPQVLIDLERAKHPASGLGQFSLRLAEELARTPSAAWRPVYLLPGALHARFGSWVGYEAASPLRRFLPGLGRGFELWHATHQESRYAPARSSTPMILTIHDLHFLEEKGPREARARLLRVRKKVERAAALTFVSEYTRELVLRHLKLPGVTQVVIHNGAEPEQVPAEKPSWAPLRPFLLALGLVRPRKNLHVLVDLVARLPEHVLVLAGNTAHPYADEIRERARALGVEARVLLAGEVSPGVKAWLLESCRAFVFPSLLEGFGLPVVEAMAYGKPVFCSERASLPEIGGDAAFYWKELDPDSMLEVFERGMTEFEQDPARARRSLAQAAKFSWAEAASKYRRLYFELLGI